MSMIFSTMIRAGKTTYFVDVKESKDGTHALVITEARISSDEGKLKSLVLVQSSCIEPFMQALNEAAAVCTVKP